MRYRAKQVAEILAISPATLRRWSDEFADLLSDCAAKRPTELSRPARRQYTEADLSTLQEASRLLKQGLSIQEAQLRLLEWTSETAERRLAAGPVALLSREELLQRIASQEEIIKAQAAALAPVKE